MKQFIKYLIIMLPLITATSCMKNIEHNVFAKNSNEQSVMLKVAVPYTAGTRSIEPTQEATIETLDILAFKVDGGVETFQYWAEGKKDAGNVEGAASQTFSATLQVQSYRQRFVIITNAHNKVEDLILQADWGNAEKEAMLKQLEVSLNGGDRWNAINAGNYTSIPMWGQSEPSVITGNTTSIGTVFMLRMIAKVEVQLDESVTGLTDKFKIKSVHVYNTNTSGRIVPKSGTEYVDADMIAQKASLPSYVVSVAGPLEYRDFTSPGVVDEAMRGAIYLFETAAKNANNFLEETCIVVGGLYDSDVEESYYRLDFLAEDDKTHLDILRNNNYICNIVAVNGRGYPTVDEAYRVKSFNMVANVLVWNEGINGNIIINGQHVLHVSHSHFDFDENARDIASTDNILTIITDYPAGWTAAVWADKAGTIPVDNDLTTNSPWLSISPALGAGDMQPVEVRLTLLANSGVARTAYIHIKAGRLTYVVEVTQVIRI